MPKGLRPITTYTLFNAVSIAAGDSSTSVAVDLREIAQSAAFSVQYVITGTGTAKIEYLMGEYPTDTFVEPSLATDIGSSLTASTGTSGRDILQFSPVMAPFMKIKVTETGTSNAVVITLKLNVQ